MKFEIYSYQILKIKYFCKVQSHKKVHFNSEDVHIELGEIDGLTKSSDEEYSKEISLTWHNIDVFIPNLETNFNKFKSIFTKIEPIITEKHLIKNSD